MARKKTITRDQILNAAYQLVATEGFSKFTARNIANKMKCSTQPIYLEFQNMDDLKDQLYEKIQAYLANDVFSKEHTGDFIVDLTLNYVQFAVKEKILYRALYVEEHGGGTRMSEFSYAYFMEELKKVPDLKRLSEPKKEKLMFDTWIMASGIASLSSGHLIELNEQEIIEKVQRMVSNILLEKND